MVTLTPASEDTRVYELCVLLPHPMGQKEEQAAVKAVEGILEEAGGKQLAKDVWGRRGLAYTIGGYDEGNFIVYHYDLDPSKLKEIDEALKILPDVLRHLVVIPPKGYEVVQYSEAYEQWLKDRENEVQEKEKEREEKIAKRIAEKAKRSVKKAEKKAEPEKKDEKVSKEELSEKLEELISDDDLDI